MLQLQQRKAELDELGLHIVLISFETPVRAELYVKETGLAWPLIIDEPRSLYEAFGMDPGSFQAIWSPKNWGVYLRIIAKGRLPKLPRNDVNQLGGDVLIDPDGKVKIHHVSRSPTDRPPIDSLLAGVRS